MKASPFATETEQKPSLRHRELIAAWIVAVTLVLALAATSLGA